MANACIKLTLTDTSPQIALFFEYFFACILFLPLVLSKGFKILKTKKWAYLIFRALFGMFTYLFLFVALQYIPLMDAALLNNTAPLFVPFLLWLWIRKKIPYKQWIGIIIGFIGIIFVLNPDRRVFSPASIFGLIAGFCAALSMTSVRLLAKESYIRVIFYYLLITSVCMLPFVILQWKPLIAKDWILLTAAGILMFCVQLLFTASFKYACASDLAPFSYISVIISGLLDWVIYQRVPKLSGLLGIVLVIIGSVLTIIFGTKKRKK